MTQQTTHCPSCGVKSAVLTVRGEVSSQYACNFCGHAFERDRVNRDEEFRTQAKLQQNPV